MNVLKSLLHGATILAAIGLVGCGSTSSMSRTPSPVSDPAPLAALIESTAPTSVSSTATEYRLLDAKSNQFNTADYLVEEINLLADQGWEPVMGSVETLDDLGRSVELVLLKKVGTGPAGSYEYMSLNADSNQWNTADYLLEEFQLLAKSGWQPVIGGVHTLDDLGNPYKAVILRRPKSTMAAH